MAEPHLHAPDVDAALDKARSAGVAQYMWHHLLVGAEADLGLGFVPDGTTSVLMRIRMRSESNDEARTRDVRGRFSGR